MIRYRVLVTSITCIALFSSLSDAQDLSKYRDFQLGMSLNSVLTQTQMKATETKIIHQRPALIQTLQWDQFHRSITGTADFTTKADALRSLQFEFYNGDLFKVVATYDPTRTEGMTTDDIIDAISLLYGKATTPVGTVAVPNAIPSYNDSERGPRPLGGCAVLLQPLPFVLWRCVQFGRFFQKARFRGGGVGPRVGSTG